MACVHVGPGRVQAGREEEGMGERERQREREREREVERERESSTVGVRFQGDQVLLRSLGEEFAISIVVFVEQ
jgi:hypothetical protein